MERLFDYFSPLKCLFGLVVLVSVFNVSFAQDFDPSALFPSWDKEAYKVEGIAGINKATDDTDKRANLFLEVIPTIIDLLLKFAAPAAFIMMVFAGVRFIYANDNEEERANAQKFFMYTAIGLLFIMQRWQEHR